MISFEMEGQPNAQSVTNDQFAAIHEIVASYWDRNHIITDAQETGGDWFLILERRDANDENTEAYFRIEFDGDWGILYEPKVKTTETVTFEWSTEKGKCADCGLPAAYRLVGQPHTLLCSVDAAYHAAHGARIDYLFEEENA